MVINLKWFVAVKNSSIDVVKFKNERTKRVEDIRDPKKERKMGFQRVRPELIEMYKNEMEEGLKEWL